MSTDSTKPKDEPAGDGADLFTALLALGVLVGVVYVGGKLIKAIGKELLEAHGRQMLLDKLPEYANLNGVEISNWELAGALIMLAEHSGQRIIILAVDSERGGVEIGLGDRTGLDCARTAATSTAFDEVGYYQEDGAGAGRVFVHSDGQTHNTPKTWTIDPQGSYWNGIVLARAGVAYRS